MSGNEVVVTDAERASRRKTQRFKTAGWPVTSGLYFCAFFSLLRGVVRLCSRAFLRVLSRTARSPYRAHRFINENLQVPRAAGSVPSRSVAWCPSVIHGITTINIPGGRGERKKPLCPICMNFFQYFYTAMILWGVRVRTFGDNDNNYNNGRGGGKTKGHTGSPPPSQRRGTGRYPPAVRNNIICARRRRRHAARVRGEPPTLPSGPPTAQSRVPSPRSSD